MVEVDADREKVVVSEGSAMVAAWILTLTTESSDMSLASSKNRADAYVFNISIPEFLSYS